MRVNRRRRMANLCGMGHGPDIRTEMFHCSPYGELLFDWIR
jgi:hypothetical protein